MQYAKILLFSILSFFIGGLGTWFYCHLPAKDISYKKSDLLELLNNISIKISDNSFSCEIEGKTVAHVITERGFLNFNSTRLSKTEFYCDNSECTLMTSNCRPWQSSECGQTFLRYKINSERKIIDSSFECIDVP